MIGYYALENLLFICLLQENQWLNENKAFFLFTIDVTHYSFDFHFWMFYQHILYPFYL